MRDIMRQSSSSMVSFTYLTYMLIDIPDDLAGSYTWLTYVSFYPPRVSSYTKLSSSTLFLSISIIISIWSDQISPDHHDHCSSTLNWFMVIILIILIMMITVMIMIGYVYDIDYDGLYYLLTSLLRVRSRSSCSWLISYKQQYE